MTARIAFVSLFMPISAFAYEANLNIDWKFKKIGSGLYGLDAALKAGAKDGRQVFDLDNDESGMERVSVPHCVNAHDSYDNRACDRGEAEFWRGWMLYRKAFRATLTMKVDGGKEIDAVAGLTVLFEENGAEKNLTNFEMTGEKGVLCGELGPLLGYIPGLVVKTDDARHRVEIRSSSRL